MKAYRQDNKTAISKKHAEWNLKNPGEKLRLIKQWIQNHPDKVNAISASRRAQKLRATPLWARLELMAYIYKLASIYNAAGIPCEVDHIVPLKSKRVSGLHCESNLQLLPSSINRSKSNRWWPDMASV